MTRVVVTGATGNVGSALLDALRSESRVSGVVGVARRAPAWRPEGVTWAEADVATDDLRPLFTGADAVVHLAWQIQPSRDLAAQHRTNVHGTARVLEAVAAAGVGTLVVASSVGAYSPAPAGQPPVDESWPTHGTPDAPYARQKAYQERLLDAFEDRHDDVRVVRLRKAIVAQHSAGSSVRRYFLGSLVPRLLLAPGRIPLVPQHPRLRFQVVHAADAADAYRRAVLDPDARGAYNLAGEGVVDGATLAQLFDARTVRVPAGLLRGGAAVAWRTRLLPIDPGWVAMALAVPLLDSSRAQRELGWSPAWRGPDALASAVAGMREGAGRPTPVLYPETRQSRLQELRTRQGARVGLELAPASSRGPATAARAHRDA